MSKEEEKFTTIDTLFLIGGCFALWADENLSEQEIEIFNNKLDEINFNKKLKITNPGFEDRRDHDLCKKEYLLWIFDTISTLKINIENNSNINGSSQEQVILTLTKQFSSSIGWGKWSIFRVLLLSYFLWFIFLPYYIFRAFKQPRQRKDGVLFLDSLIKADGSVDEKEVHYLKLFRKKTKRLFWKF